MSNKQNDLYKLNILQLGTQYTHAVEAISYLKVLKAKCLTWKIIKVI